MSCTNTTTINTASEVGNVDPIMTIGGRLDYQIEAARKRVEVLCIAKAKAETLQLLNAPYNDLVDICFG